MSNSVVHYICSVSVSYGRLWSIMHHSDYMERMVLLLNKVKRSKLPSLSQASSGTLEKLLFLCLNIPNYRIKIFKL